MLTPVNCNGSSSKNEPEINSRVKNYTQIKMKSSNTTRSVTQKCQSISQVSDVRECKAE